MGLHDYAGHSYIIEVTKMNPLGADRYEYAAKLTRLHRYSDRGPGEDLQVPRLGEQYGKTPGQAEGRAMRVVEAFLDGKPHPDVYGDPAE